MLDRDGRQLSKAGCSWLCQRETTAAHLLVPPSERACAPPWPLLSRGSVQLQRPALPQLVSLCFQTT